MEKQEQTVTESTEQDDIPLREDPPVKEQKSLPESLAAAVNKKYGLKETVALKEEPLRVAGAIAQAGVENSRGTFTTQRQIAFIAFIEKQDIVQYTLPDKVWNDLYDVLVGMMVGLSNTNDSSNESKKLNQQIVKLIFRTVSQEPKRLELLGVDKELLEALNLARMLTSKSDQEVDLAVNFCMLLLH